jgi:hypothetical protein
MYALGVPEGYHPYDVFYATENRYISLFYSIFVRLSNNTVLRRNKQSTPICERE